MKPVIIITQQMRDDAYKFAYELETKKNQYARLGQNLDELIETTYIGKLGELAFLSYLNQSGKFPKTGDMLKIFDGQENIDNYDFELCNGDTVDVKTGYLAKHKRLMVNASQLNNIPKSVYVAVKVFSEGGEQTTAGIIDKDFWTSAVIEGWINHGELVESGSRYWGKADANAILYERLKEIDTLVERF